jgi:hypothetical protein
MPAGPYPSSAPPYPVSVGPYPSSAAPYPASAAPYGWAPGPAPKRRGWIIVLSILSGVLLLAAGGVGTLYYLDHEKASKAAADQQSQIDDLNRQIDQREAELEALEDDYADLKAESAECYDAVQAFITAEPEPGATQQEIAELIGELILDMIQSC